MTANYKTVLVTGGCGYLGSQLIRDLALDERLRIDSIRILDNMRGGDYQALYDLPGRGIFEFIEGDLLDPGVVRLALKDADVVIHLAAMVRTPMSFEDPGWVEQVNHWGTSRLIESCIESQTRRIIFTSSAAVYGPGGPFSELEACRPLGAYAESKLHAEKAMLSAIDRGISPTILRLGTLYGLSPVVRYDAVVNRFSYLAGVKRTLTMLGDGKQKRPLIHVRDASSAIIFSLLQSQRTSEQTFNVAGENASINDLLEIIQSIIPGIPVQFTDQNIRNRVSIEVVADAIKTIGWHPKYGVRDGISEILERFCCIRELPK